MLKYLWVKVKGSAIYFSKNVCVDSRRNWDRERERKQINAAKCESCKGIMGIHRIILSTFLLTG